jgi:hypothetical protein
MQLPRCRQLQRVQVRNERLTACVRAAPCLHAGSGQMTSCQRQFPADGGPIAVYVRSPIHLQPRRRSPYAELRIVFICNFAYNKDRGSYGGFCSLC